MIAQDLSRFQLPPDFRGRPQWYVQLWWLVQASLFAWSPQILYGWRRFGAKIGKGAIIRPSARITYPWKVSIGDFAWVGDDVVLYSLGEIDIGANAVVSQHCYLCTGSHDYTRPTFDIYAKPILVGAEAWRGAVVGARSSVFEDIPDLMLAKGTPAKPFKKRLPTGDQDKMQGVQT